MKKQFIKNKGFTLAEVLVTLSIIGVISAMVIPSLQKSFQEAQYRAGAKNAYSMLGQAIMMMKADDNLPAFANDNTELTTKFCNHLSCIKTDQAKNIFASTYNYYENSGSGYDYSWVAAPSVILKNGMLAFFVYDAANCTGNAGTLFTTVCADIYIDTNGKKGPNKFGRDVFHFHITSNKSPLLYPMGGRDDNSGSDTSSEENGGYFYWNFANQNRCSESGSKWGGSCAGRVLEKGYMDY